MIKHIFKQIWTQRGKNGWIILELFIVFVILWYIVDFFSVMFITSRIPVGTEIENVHRVVIATLKEDNPNYIAYGKGSEEPGRNFLRIVDQLKSHPKIESVCIGQWFYPYCTSNSSSRYNRDSLGVHCQILRATPEYFSMFNVRPHDGGDPEILAKAFQQERSAVLSLEANRKLFKDKIGTGERIYEDKDSVPGYVAGVSHHIKRHLYEGPAHYIIFLFKESELLKYDEDEIWNSADICVKTKPGVSQADFPYLFKEEMKQKLKVGNYFLADIMPLAKQEKTFLKLYVTDTMKYRIGLAVFFLVNIFLGVLGTFWLRIEKRKAEIGLRMSFGSTKAQVMRQMLAESYCLHAIAFVPALIVCLNLAYLDVMPTNRMDYTVWRFLLSTFLTYGLLSLIISLSVWYPAKRSATILPAEALHNE